MLPQRLRTWIWRANGLLAVLLLAVGAWAFSEPKASTAFEIPEARQVDGPEPLRASVDFQEMVALARRFHGWGDRKQVTRPEPVEPPSGRLPLRALACRGWISWPEGPDLVVLMSKDPARPETYMPTEDQPDQGVEIERIEPIGGGLARISVRRGDETWVFTMKESRSAGDGRVRITKRASGSVAGEATGTGPADPETRASVKLLPFYDDRGAFLGARVTGIRPGSDIADLGLEPGDIVVGLGPNRVGSVAQVRSQLIGSEHPSIEILRGLGREQKRLRLDG